MTNEPNREEIDMKARLVKLQRKMWCKSLKTKQWIAFSRADNATSAKPINFTRHIPFFLGNSGYYQFHSLDCTLASFDSSGNCNFISDTIWRTHEKVIWFSLNEEAYT